MLAVLEQYLDSVRILQTHRQAEDILARIVAQFGFRSGFLLAFATDLQSVTHLLDTDRRRAVAGRRMVRQFGLAPGVAGIRFMLAAGTLIRLGPGSVPADHPYRPFWDSHDVTEATVLPIAHNGEVAGLVGYSGVPGLSPADAANVELLSFALFARLYSGAVAPGARAGAGALTRRELEVMQHTSRGLTSKEVARRLGIAERTVNEHIEHVVVKLGTRNRTSAVADLVSRKLLA